MNRNVWNFLLAKISVSGVWNIVKSVVELVLSGQQAQHPFLLLSDRQSLTANYTPLFPLC